MASPTTLLTQPKPLPPFKPKSPTTATNATISATATATTTTSATRNPRRRGFLSLVALTTLSSPWLFPIAPALASDEDYVKETEEVINKVRTTITMDKNDPNVATAVTELRETSNSWVAKYRREKALLGRASFRDMYSALNAVSGHYISFGPTAPIPAKRKARILEEVETAEKALKRGR